MLTSTNPATGEEFASYQPHDPQAVDAAIERAGGRQEEWRRTPFADRSAVMRAAAERLEERRDELAQLMAREMGKPVTDGRSEVDKCAWVCRYYADHGEQQLSDEIIETDHSRSYIHYEPLGVVLAVMPWNFPLWQVFRFAAPGLMAGNAGLLKHASNVSGSALAIQEIFETAGAPDGLFATLLIPSDRVESVIEHPLVRAVTLTGSEPAGRAVAATAGSLLKPTVLELGGSDAYVVMADADLPSAAATCATARLINGGQSCIAGKRFIVEESIHDEFVDLLRTEFEQRVVGDPLDDKTQIGPMARHDLRDECHQQVVDTMDAGAHLVIGGAIPSGPGAYYPPTILTGVEPGMPGADEEVFGPAASVMRATDGAHAIRLANASDFGLGAAVFTSDPERGEELAARHLEAGSCFVNTNVASDPRLPFGGIKNSGYGRELSGLGIRSFVNAKTVVVA